MYGCVVCRGALARYVARWVTCGLQRRYQVPVSGFSVFSIAIDLYPVHVQRTNAYPLGHSFLAVWNVQRDPVVPVYLQYARIVPCGARIVGIRNESAGFVVFYSLEKSVILVRKVPCWALGQKRSAFVYRGE